jgi:hypothetical protein
MTSQHAAVFGHREHVHLAWRLLGEHAPDQAVVRAEEIIRQIALAHGAPAKYHQTITEAWVRIVAHHREQAPTLAFDEFVERFPPLLDRRLLERHWSPELLAGRAARDAWVEPDLRPLVAEGSLGPESLASAFRVVPTVGPGAA